MKGLVILPRFRNEGPSRSLAYFHPKNSLTWRWGLSGITRPSLQERRTDGDTGGCFLDGRTLRRSAPSQAQGLRVCGLRNRLALRL